MTLGYGFGFPRAQSSGLAPSLNLDFAGTAALPSTVTFSRGTNATFTNSAGAIQLTSGIDAPRFDYDPVTLACKGLMVEGVKTNLVLNSTIDGASLATQTVTVTAVTTTLSFYGTGTVILSGVFIGSLVGSGAYPTRSSLTFLPTAGPLVLTVTGNVQYCNLEVGAYPTSYIPTAAAAATRNNDVAAMTGTNFSSWYNQTQGTIVAVATQPYLKPSVAIGAIASISDSTTSNRLAVVINAPSTSNYAAFVSAVSQFNINKAAAISAGVPSKVAAAYAAADFAMSWNGATPGTASAGALPTVDTMYICSNSTGVAQFLDGTIARLTYYPTRLPNATLQALTA